MRVAAAVVVCLVACGLAACGRHARDRKPPADRPNVLLVTIDTLRADRVGAGSTPALDRLAASGLRFTAARTVAPLTLPAHASVMTGLLPPSHGVRANGIDRLSDRHATVARVLKEGGYRTAAVVGAFVLDRRFGLAQGFDSYDDQIARDPAASDRLEAERPAPAVIDRALAWLESGPGPSGPGAQAPFFLWVHLYDPHAPYNPPPEFRTRARSAYDGEILFADTQLARLLDRLAAQRLVDRTLIIVAGDHGEGLDEHGERTHGMLLYDSTLRVPLIVAAPGQPAGMRSDAVSLVDVAPTILRAAGITPPAEMKGRDLMGRVEPAARPKLDAAADKSEVYAETEYPRVAGWSPLHALTDGRWKAIRAGASAEVYDLQNDPGELHDLAASQSNLARNMATRIDAIVAAAGSSPSTGGISPETAERLRSLGYVASAPAAATASAAPNPAKLIAAWNAFEEALTALNRKRPDALAQLQRLAGAHPQSSMFRTMFARALKDSGAIDRALREYRAAAARWPTDAALLHDLAVAARETARDASGPAARALRDEAARAEQAAIALAPESASAHNGLGLLAADQGHAADAAREFERATALDATNASYWANLGNARRAAGDRAGAEQSYRQALAIDAQSVDALNGRGVLLVEANHPQEAAPLFERAIAASPEFVEARLNLGIALQQSGQAARAAAEYRRVLAAPPRFARERDAARKLLDSLGGGK